MHRAEYWNYSMGKRTVDVDYDSVGRNQESDCPDGICFVRFAGTVCSLRLSNLPDLSHCPPNS